MTKIIYKYPLEVAGKQVVSLPFGSEILSVQMQNRKLCLWALVDPNEECEDRHIEMYGTGHPLGYDFGVPHKYIATFQMEFEQLVFHVFENKL